MVLTNFDNAIDSNVKIAAAINISRNCIAHGYPFMHPTDRKLDFIPIKKK